MVEVTESPITQADMVAAEMQAQKHYQTAHDYEMGLRQSYATHREAAAKEAADKAAKAERDRIVAWLRDDASLTEIEARRVLGNLIVLTTAETEAWAKLVAMKHGIADALEKQNG